MKKLLGTIFGLCFIIHALASQISYDQIPISPQTWEEVDLTYINTIDSKNYTEHANLLRPVRWIEQNHLDKVGVTVHLNKEQLGIDADVIVIAIKPVKLNYSNNNHKKTKPVIASFITHSNDVWDYIFKDKYGHTEVIQAVSGHPFYSIDRQAFLPIGQFKIGERVKNNSSSIISLLKKSRHNRRVKDSYNFEVYQKHNYKVSTIALVEHRIVNIYNKHINKKIPIAYYNGLAYRGEPRPIEEVFNNGLKNYRSNNMRKAAGIYSTVSANYGISTTTDYSIAEAFANKIQAKNIYAIDLNNAQRAYHVDLDSERFGHKAIGLAEINVNEDIPKEWIIGAFEINDGLDEQSLLIPNSNYKLQPRIREDLQYYQLLKEMLFNVEPTWDPFP